MAAPTGPQVVAEAEKLLGRPYVYGAAGPADFDCSGLVQYVYKQLGMGEPRTSSEQYAAGGPVPASGLAPGDLVFSEWAGDDVPHHGHVAIYAGGGQVIEAPHAGGVVQRVPLDASYLAHVDGATHPTGLAPAPAGAQPSTLDAILGGLLGAPGALVAGVGNNGPLGFLGSAVDDLTKILHFVTLLFQPSTYVRIGAGVGGLILISSALFVMARSGKG